VRHSARLFGMMNTVIVFRQMFDTPILGVEQWLILDHIIGSYKDIIKYK